MNEYQQIKAALSKTLERAGLSLSDEELHPDVFGSAHSEYLGNGLAYRLIWDGKDGCGYIQSLEKGAWVNLKAFAPESEHNAFESALVRMRISLVEHIALSKIDKNSNSF